MQGGSRVRRWLILALLWGVALLFLIPFLWMLSSSLKPNYQIFEVPPRWIPNPPRWENYVEALTILPFPLYIRNTAIITLLTIAGHLLSCTVIAYAFARLRAPGRDFLFVVMLATMMLPYPVTMVPLYVLFNRLGWINTFLPLVVPAYLGIPFYIFLMRQFFLTIPRDFEDAARIDGANTLQIIGRIMLPMAMPALATVTIFTFQATWNDFLAPLIYLQRPELYTVTLGLQFFRSTYTTNWAYLMAASLVTTLPVIVVFFAAQRYFIEGITLTGVKG
ncbi:MAG: carbohydrate ABC transporter permease [Caldilinea sp.]|nr:carbohydrate ABC transporter permease [Caldilinea sp.]MCB9113754.1 carbohydrate ABC transporter permease [Caldilineaceae bacterium]MCB0038995.1 carbohydrate ABC transporter permease [Caldilinea sp.]MCB9123024.1 carbohydrate ABC transporter permease [Caldilineaceae bacterium]MCW5839943.1 carbohydrate ABC transporter permease [Caldilinea sp.]